LTVGEFGRRAGVTVKALRNWDAAGILRPAAVDPRTGYRRYLATQLEEARLIRALRDWDIGLAEIGELVVLWPDRAGFARALAPHRRRIEARVTRLRGILHALDHVITLDDRSIMNGHPTATETLTAQQHRELGKDLFNHVWTLMEKEDRTADDDALMVHEAHASLYHWLCGGAPVNSARGEWQVSRVYCVLRRPEPARYHAQRVLQLCQRHGLADWDLAFAYEALARAESVAGDLAAAAAYVTQARAIPIAEPEDRELLDSDLATITTG
jgi:DNA-binding transcriptional MerR regulator